MATLLLLTNDMRSSAEILPALELLPHQVKVAQAEATALLDAPAADVILLDARRDLVGARSLCRLMETTGKEAPLLVIANEGGLPALSADWGFDDLLLATAGPAEVDVRLRLAMTPSVAANADPLIQSGNTRDRRGRLQRQAQRGPARSHLHRVRAAEIPRTTPRAGIQPPATAERRLGIRLLRRYAHRRRACAATAGQARPRERVGHRHCSQRGVPVRHASRGISASYRVMPVFRAALRATTTAPDSRCLRRRSAGGDGGTTLFRSRQLRRRRRHKRTSQRAERAIKHRAMREQLQNELRASGIARRRTEEE